MKKVLKEANNNNNKKNTTYFIYGVQLLEKNKQGMCLVCKKKMFFQDYSFTG